MIILYIFFYFVRVWIHLLPFNFMLKNHIIFWSPLCNLIFAQRLFINHTLFERCTALSASKYTCQENPPRPSDLLDINDNVCVRNISIWLWERLLPKRFVITHTLWLILNVLNVVGYRMCDTLHSRKQDCGDGMGVNREFMIWFINL